MTIAIGHRAATFEDVPTLARMNQQLIEDEGHRTRMSVDQLEARLRTWLDGDYTATLFEWECRLVAYGLWRDEADWVYLRQFFVARNFRRRGFGAEAIRVLAGEVWPANKRIRIDVLIGNRPALDFWRAVGCIDYMMTLEMERSD